MRKIDAEPLVSVIVPVYNVEKYLDRCMESIVGQTYKNLEIILVDDGSTDNSGKMCDEWGKRDKRVRVVHKENGGLSDARNYGLDRMKGEYVCFVDSDDSMDDSGVEYMYKLAKKDCTKIVAVPHFVVTKTKKEKFGGGYGDCVLSQKEALARMLQDKGFTVSAWSKIYRSDLFKDVRFPKGKIYEDNGTTHKLIMQCDKISYSGEAFYNYYIRNNSLTKGKFSMNKMDYISMADEMCDAVIRKFPDLEIPVMNKRLDVRFSILAQILDGSMDGKKQKAKNEIELFVKKQRFSVLTKSGFNKRTKIAMLLLCIGEKPYMWAWKRYQWRKG